MKDFHNQQYRMKRADNGRRGMQEDKQKRLGDGSRKVTHIVKGTRW